MVGQQAYRLEQPMLTLSAVMNYTEMEAKVGESSAIFWDTAKSTRSEKQRTMSHGALLLQLCRRLPMAHTASTLNGPVNI